MKTACSGTGYGLEVDTIRECIWRIFKFFFSFLNYHFLNFGGFQPSKSPLCLDLLWLVEMIMYYGRYTDTAFLGILQITWSAETKLHTTTVWINFLGFVVIIVKNYSLFSKISKHEKEVLLYCPVVSKNASVLLFKPRSDLVVLCSKVKFSENRHRNIGGKLCDCSNCSVVGR